MAATAGSPSDHTEEREVKLAVDDGFVLPSLAPLDGVSAVDRGESRTRAVYWDSDDLALAHAGVGVRHRNGVWTFKGRSRRHGDSVVREELEVTADGDAIPPAVAARLASVVDPRVLHPLAHLEGTRHQVDVSDAGGRRAELVHDRVDIVDGERVLARFAEVEVEFTPTDQDLADRVVRLLVAAGAVVDSTPKYLRALRALGHNPPEKIA